MADSQSPAFHASRITLRAPRFHASRFTLHVFLSLPHKSCFTANASYETGVEPRSVRPGSSAFRVWLDLSAGRRIAGAERSVPDAASGSIRRTRASDGRVAQGKAGVLPGPLANG